MMDYFCTPTEIARQMIRCVKVSRVKTVADFAAGTGELLEAAKRRWKAAKTIALDIDSHKVRNLQTAHPDWGVGRCDFLSAGSRAKSRFLRHVDDGISVVVLNPPFSCRGARTHEAVADNIVVKCSQAMAFVLNAIPFLAPAGEIIAILPRSCLTSEKDQKAWSQLLQGFRRGVLQFNGYRTFDGCAAKSVLVRIWRRTRRATPDRPQRDNVRRRRTDGHVTIVRGSAPMHRVMANENGCGTAFVHSTDLSHGQMNLRHIRNGTNLRSTVGPAVLLPRVGLPRRDKLVILRSRHRVALSDCVLSLQCQTAPAAERLRSLLAGRLADVQNLYGGTCAPYVTVASVVGFIEQHGWDVSVKK